jgi:MoxR-like ATPase
MPILRHRIVTNFNAEAEGIRSDKLVQQLLDHLPAHAADDFRGPAGKLLKAGPV